MKNGPKVDVVSLVVSQVSRVGNLKRITSVSYTHLRHAVAFKDDLYKTGRLKEVSMSLKSDGVVDSAKQAFYALRLWKHSKINPFELVVPQKPVNGIDGVRRLMKAAEEVSK